MKKRLHTLRSLMATHSHENGPQIDAYIVTPFDEHQTFQTDDTESYLQYISGYTGPTGFALVSSRRQYGATLAIISLYRFQHKLPRSGSTQSTLLKLTVSSTVSGKYSHCPRSLRSLCGWQ